MTPRAGSARSLYYVEEPRHLRAAVDIAGVEGVDALSERLIHDRRSRAFFGHASRSESGRPIAHVAADLGIHSETLRKRVCQSEADQGLRPDSPTSEEREERAERENSGVRSPQTLSEADRRIVAAWAADCAERVLGLFEAEAPGDSRPGDAIARTRAFARGELGVADGIRRRFIGGAAAVNVTAPVAAAAARAAGQAASIPHMGAHALGAAAYAAKAAGLAGPDRPETVGEEIRWQLDHMSPAVRAALRQLPPVGENRSGPLGPGLLASGLLGSIIRDLQVGLTSDR